METRVSFKRTMAYVKKPLDTGLLESSTLSTAEKEGGGEVRAKEPTGEHVGRRKMLPLSRNKVW